MDNDSKRILVIGSSSSPHVVNRMAGFAKRGYQITILTDRIAGLEEMNEVSLYPTYHQINMSSVFSKTLYKINRFKELWNIYKELKSFKPDIVHIHYALNRLGIIFALLLRKPIIVSVMGGDILFNEKTVKRIDQYLVKLLLKRANEITTKSDYLKHEVLKFGNYGHKTRKIIWGVDAVFFYPFEESSLRDELNIPNKAQIIFCPKSLHPIYNIDLIIKAVSIVRDDFPNVFLILTDFHSDKEYKAMLIDLIEKLSLQKLVMIMDHIGHKEIVRYYNISDIIIGIPRYDGLPQSLLESMACAKPHILGNLERYKEIVEDGKSAMFTDFKPKDIAQSIKKLLSDKALRKAIGDKSREIVLNEADIQKNLNLVETIYEKYLPVHNN